MMYKYGMRLRGFAPMCQPMEGLKDWQDDASGRYWSVLWYDHKLTEKECFDYDLEFIEKQ